MNQLLALKCCVLSMVLAAAPIWAAEGKTGIDDFNPDLGPFSLVNTIALQADDKVVVGGIFTTVGGQPCTNIARLHPDGSLDRAFDPAAFHAWADHSSIADLAVQADGKILVAGEFRSSGKRLDSLVRLNHDGSMDWTFSPQIDGTLSRVAVTVDRKIIIAGSFSAAHGELASALARLHSTGVLDTEFAPGLSGNVSDLALNADGSMVIAGFFRKDGALDSEPMAWVSADGSQVRIFGRESGVDDDSWLNFAVQPDGKIIFEQVEEIFITFRRLTAGGDPDPTFQVDAGLWAKKLVAQSDGRILVAGGNTNHWYPPEVAARWELYRLNSDGSVDNDFQPRIDSSAGIGVQDVVVQPDGKIIVGGMFTSINGQPRNGLGRIIPSVRPPRLTSAKRLNDGAYQFSFANPDRVVFTALATTNLALPVAEWDVLGNATSAGGDLYQFTDPAAPSHPRRFYQLRSQ